MSSPNPATTPDATEPATRPTHRTFTTEYRNNILDEYNQAPHGENLQSCAAKACTNPNSGNGRKPEPQRPESLDRKLRPILTPTPRHVGKWSD